MKKHNLLILILLTVLLLPTTKSYAYNGLVEFIPIGAKEMREMGYEPPLPFTISPLVHFMKNYQEITNVVATGDFGAGDIPADVTMNDVSVNAITTGLRLAVNPLPFLSIFGIGLYSDGYTEFDATAAAIPGVIREYTLKQRLAFNAVTGVVGMNAAYGTKIGAFTPFVSLNGNVAWSKANLTDTIINTLVFSGRVGTAIPMPKKMRLAFWTGAMYQHTLLGTEVTGEYVAQVPEDVFLLPITTESGYLPVLSKYTATQKPRSPLSMIVGMQFAPIKYFDIMTEVGFFGKFTVNVSLGFNF